MIYVGIDIAKRNHYACLVSADGEVLVDPFPFTNDHQGFSLLLSHLSVYEKSDLLIGMESTAHYAENLTAFLFPKGFRICIINPIQTASLRKGNIRKTKNDRIDSLMIVKALQMNHYRLFSQQDMDSLAIKNLCRFRQKLVKSRTKVKIQLISFVDRSFPELQYFFQSGIHGKACYALLEQSSSPDEIAKMHLARLSNLLNKTSRGHFGKDTAKALKALATNSVGTNNDILSLQIKQSIIQIRLLDSQIKEVNDSIKALMEKVDSVLKTIPGIGDLNGAMILGEIGDIRRFAKPSQLLAYSGLDPAVYQSGNFNASRTRMSKRGSKILRYALMNAAWQLTLHNETFKAYYDLKVSQGRCHYAALGHVAGKLVRVLHKILTDNIAFDLD